jgi:hypothetical protein
MDQNRDSIDEFLAAADVAQRAVVQDGQACTEWWWLKDRLPARFECATGTP